MSANGKQAKSRGIVPYTDAELTHCAALASPIKLSAGKKRHALVKLSS